MVQRAKSTGATLHSPPSITSLTSSVGAMPAPCSLSVLRKLNSSSVQNIGSLIAVAVGYPRRGAGAMGCSCLYNSVSGARQFHQTYPFLKRTSCTVIEFPERAMIPSGSDCTSTYGLSYATINSSHSPSKGIRIRSL